MPRSNADPIAVDQAAALKKAICDFQDLPRAGVAALAIVRDLSKDCTTSDNLENKLAEVTDILVQSKRIYGFGNAIMFEEGQDEGKKLTPLLIAGSVEAKAPAKLGNILKCEMQGKEGRIQFPPTLPIVTNVLHSEYTQQALPVVKTYANRPVYDSSYKLRRPEWHRDIGLLVHGIEVEVSVAAGPADCNLKVTDRLPPHLKTLLGEFPFASDADAANALAALLTIPLMPLFIEELHPILVLDGTQPGIGKTEFAKLIGVLCDGEPSIVRPFLRDDDELRKDIGSALRARPAGCLVLDNAKRSGGEPVKSEVLESMSTNSRLSFRILGTSEVYERPNDIICAITMNEARLSADLVDRGLTIQLAVEGSTRKQKFKGKPLPYATKHRKEILAELVSMIERWKQQGMPRAQREYRFREWSAVIGGILEANGYPEFLGNLERVANSQNSELDDLAAMAEKCLIKFRDSGFYWMQGSKSPAKGETAAKWEPVFKEAEVLQDKLLGAKSANSKGKMIGNYFNRFVDQPVEIGRRDKTGNATLRAVSGQGGKHFYFEISGEIAQGPDSGPEAGSPQRPESDLANQKALLIGPTVKAVVQKPCPNSAVTKITTGPTDCVPAASGGQRA